MDARRFDGLTRYLAQVMSLAASRRSALSAMGGAVVAGWLGGLSPVAAKKRRKRRKQNKRKKKRPCLFGQQRCRDRRCHGCCSNADCGGNVCQDGACSRCPAEQRSCRGGCIPETSCCTDEECDGGKTCIDGACACRADQRLCAGACIPADTCCDSADCGGAACLNGQCHCPAGQQDCRGECIPETDCCRSSDCDPCERCEEGTCVGGCPDGQECQNGTCGCPAGQRLCAADCIPEGDCCTDADCGDLFLCAQGTCVMGQGTCPAAGPIACQAAPNTCGQSPGSICACFESMTGDIRCGANQGFPDGTCTECINDRDCRQLHPDVPGVFCVRGGPACGCLGTSDGFCMAPCSN